MLIATSIRPLLRGVSGIRQGNHPKRDDAGRRRTHRVVALPTFALDRLSRYERLLWRQARQIVFTLESLRRRKRQPTRPAFPFSFRRREPGALSNELE
jgi:hypothetical protein